MLAGAVPVLGPGRYFGTPVRRASFGDLRLVETSFRPNARIERHRHERAYFCLITNGAFEESRGRDVRDYRAGTLVFRPAGEEHSERFGERGGRCLNVEIPQHWLERHASTRVTLPSSLEMRGPRIASIADRIGAELRESDDLRFLALEGLALELVAETARAARSPESRLPAWIDQVVERLDAAESIPSLADLAAIGGVHPSHLARTFRRLLRCTPADYVRRRRIERARRALTETDQAIGEIALDAGFCDQSHFTRAFRRATGTTPAAYRSSRR
ncbi:MAG TPA: AraC family transcriptional regulator [Candidatus Udaeobacter sp.]|jgi:AraC-like DNA-binding protein|nr:AraC family transcriptional regulator [Candidatus Udaeobacter sp.]